MENKKIEELNTNNYATYALKYYHKGYSVIPDKYGKKMPAIKAWSDYCYRLPSKEEISSWSNTFTESNIAVCLGQESKIIALDIDADDKEILDIVMPILPKSPVVKRGSKGETRFFRYTGETTDILKYNSKVVVEILSNGKKTTLPPSLHPNGSNYVWTSDKTLLDVDASELPILPPALFAHLGSKLRATIPETIQESYGKLYNGRNDELSSLCGKLIGEGKTVDEVIRELIKHDEETSETPLFTDPNENRTTHAITNALQFYSNHLLSINTKRFRESKEYEEPVMQSVADMEKIKEVRLGKSQSKVTPKKPRDELPPAPSVLGSIYSTILSNSWVKQPELAFGASLALMSTLISRKVVFQGMSPNLYVLNIAPSGSGKDMPQQFIKNTLIDIGADSLLGAGDYVSDASLMNSLEVQPTRLDVMDEAGGILNNVNNGRSEYNGKMADVLAELYTTSNGKYLGRATAEGRKGACYRPNVNILASTTPTGFSEGVSLKAIEKGLLGRFLIFQGNAKQKAERLKTFPKLPFETKQCLKFWYSFRPEDFKTTNEQIAGIPQNYVELEADNEANKRLDSIFEEFDTLRISSSHNDPKLPIVARLYQQMIKLVIISACSRVRNSKIPVINTKDVEFGYKTIKFYYNTIGDVIDRYIFGNKQEAEAVKLLNVIRDNGNFITKSDLSRATRSLGKRQRDSIIEDLIDSGDIIRDMQNHNGRNHVVYFLVEERDA